MLATFATALLVCRDLARSRDFYRDVLGLAVTTDASPHWVELALGAAASLELHPAGASLRVQPGSLQLGFEVPDVDRFVSDARTIGATVFQDPYEEQRRRHAVIADPDGYPIRIVSRVGAARPTA